MQARGGRVVVRVALPMHRIPFRGTYMVRKAFGIAIAVGYAAWLASLPVPAEASVVIAATRVIYDANESEVTLKLSNEGQSPALVQSWIDAGDVRGAPSNI